MHINFVVTQVSLDLGQDGDLQSSIMIVMIISQFRMKDRDEEDHGHGARIFINSDDIKVLNKVSSEIKYIILIFTTISLQYNTI